MSLPVEGEEIVEEGEEEGIPTSRREDVWAKGSIGETEEDAKEEDDEEEDALEDDAREALDPEEAGAGRDLTF